MTRILSQLIIATLLLSGAGAASADAMSGTAKLYGDSWTVRDAIAFKDEGYTMVLFSSAPGLAKIVEDGEIGFFDEDEYRAANKATLVKLMIMPDGNIACFLTMRDGDAGNHCGMFTENMKLTARDDKRVAGTFDWSDDDESLNLKFDLPISGEAAKN